MKYAAAIGFVFLLQPCFSQQSKIDFSFIDRKVVSIYETSPQRLSYKLTSSYTTELEKVRSIYRWITEHIEYNVYRPVRRWNAKYINYEEDEDALPGLKPLNERVSSIVLKKKTAICDQYARLFKTLCDYAGICSEIIMGYAKPDPRSGRRFGTNHTWNAVQIGGTWHLLDVTWSSGYILNNREFIKSFEDRYFLTPPEIFIRDHHPEDLQWALLDKIPVPREFIQSPFQYSGFVRSKVVGYSPRKGIIDASVGDTLRIELETNDDIVSFFVTDSYATDHSLENKPATYRVKGKKINYDYVVASSDKEWLYVILNYELVLRYKLNIKKDIPSYTIQNTENISQ